MARVLGSGFDDGSTGCTEKRFRRIFGLSNLCALLLLTSTGGLDAQGYSGPFLRSGQVRFDLSPSLLVYDERFGLRTTENGVLEVVEPLAFDLDGRDFDRTLIPGLAPLDDAIRSIFGTTPVDPLGLGRSNAIMNATVTRLPLGIEAGITDWLTVGISVPVVKRNVDATVAFTGEAGNLGAAPDGTLFLSEFDTALADLAAESTSLCDQGFFGCDESMALLADARQFRDRLEAAYSFGGFFPRTDTDVGNALQGRVTEFVDAFGSFGIGGVPSTLPLADAPLDEAALQDFVTTDSRIGVDSLSNWRSLWALGDVEIHAAVRLIDRWTSPEPSEGVPIRFQLGIGGLVRLGTGTLDSPDHVFDIGSGDGQTDLEGQLLGRLGLGRRVVVDGRAWLGVQREATILRRVAAVDAVLPPVSSRAEVVWDPGDYRGFDLTPAYYFMEDFGLLGGYRYRSKEADSFADPGSGEGSTLPELLALLEVETESTVHEAKIGLIYAPLRSTDPRVESRPIEFFAGYRWAVSGSGGRTPKGSRFEVTGRYYASFW